MHVLRLVAPEFHGPFGRLLDRIRLAGLPVASISARAGAEGFAVEVELSTGDHAAIERLAHQMRQTIGARDVEIDCACAQPAASPYLCLQPSAD